MKVFFDSDVVISSLISEKGAAFLLVNQPNLTKFISNLSTRELKKVVNRLSLDPNKLETLVKSFQIEQTVIPPGRWNR